MRKLLYCAILIALLFVPVQRLDVAKLEPVQTVALYIDGKELIVETDTGNTGRGKELLEAVNDLKENTPGVIYLDTAQYLLVTDDTEQYLDALGKHLHQNVKVSKWDGKSSIKSAAQYLRIQENLHTLRYLKNISKK